MPARDRSRSRPFARKGVIGPVDSHRAAAAFVAHHSPPPEEGGFFDASRVAIQKDKHEEHEDTKNTMRRCWTEGITNETGSR